MKSNKLIFLLILFTALALTACSGEDNPVTPGDGGGDGGGDTSQNTNASGQPTPTFENSSGLMATISYETETVPGFPSAQLTIAYAQFGSGVNAGNVSVNSNSLGTITQSGNTYYMVPSQSNPTQQLTNVNFNGSAHSWTVAGANGVPALSGEVTSPSNYSLTAPENGATVSSSGGIEVNWNNSGSGSKVLIVLAKVDNSNTYKAYQNLDDSGSYTIPSGDLGDFSGETMLQVVKYNTAAVSQGGSDYHIVSEIVKQAVITVN